MAKKLSSKVKVELNRIIILALKTRDMPYRNMDQATADMARVIGVDISNLGGLAGRRAVASAIAGKAMPDIETIKNAERAKAKRERVAKRASRYKPTYLPGFPSSSTLERDIKTFYDSWEWKRLSYDVKLERGRRCECCGAAAPEVRIITDHIKPLRKFWHLRLDPTNMQVLCDDCNRGKGSRDDTDFRPTLTPDEEQRLSDIKIQLRLN